MGILTDGGLTAAGSPLVSRIFISHSNADAAAAIALRDWLLSLGWDDVFLDLDPERGISAGERWQAALKAGVDRCEMVLCVVSPMWAASRWCLAEFLLAKMLNKRIFAAIVEATPFSALPSELTAEWQVTDLTAGVLDFEITVTLPPGDRTSRVAFSSEGVSRLRTGIERAGLDAKFFQWPPQHDPQRPPYRGLRPLEAEDAGIFSGREAPIIAALDKIRGLRDAAPPRLMIILGASGAGKSSFLRAGLLPRLQRDDRNFWPLPVIRPERAVLSGDVGLIRSLEAAYQALRMSVTRSQLREAVDGGAAALRPILVALSARIMPAPLAGAANPPTLILPIDQGEELFLAEGGPEARSFMTLLHDLTATDDPPLAVLIAVRSASFALLQQDATLSSIRKEVFDLAPMPKGAYADIIKGPPRHLVGTDRLEIEDALVDALLADIERSGSADTLPLLAFTLERLYREYKGGGILKLDHYETLGRLKGSIDEAVNRAFRAADNDPRVSRDNQVRLANLRRGLIPWLAGIDPDTGHPRRRIARLSEIPEEARALIGHLVEERLLTTDVDKLTEETTIEPAHESLLRLWGLLEGWLKEDFGALSTLEGLKRAARDWNANARRADWLVHSGGRLEAAQAVAGRSDLGKILTPDEKTYLTTAGQAAVVRQRRAKRIARLVSLAALSIAAIVSVLALSLLHAYLLRLETQGRFVADLANQRSADHDYTSAILLALEGLPQPHATTLENWVKPNVPEAEAALYRAYTGLQQTDYLRDISPFGGLQNFAFNSDRTQWAVATVEGEVKIADLSANTLLARFRRIGDAAVTDIQFDNSSDRLIAARRDGTAQVLDARSGVVLTTFIGHQGPLSSARFSPDNNTVVTASDDKTARIWDARSGRLLQILTGHPEEVRSAVFDHAGRRVVTTAGDGVMRLWDATTGALLAAFDAQMKYLVAASFSPDDQTLIATAESGTTLWDVGRRSVIGKFSEVPFAMYANFRPGGGAVAMPLGNSIAIVGLPSGTTIATLEGHQKQVLGVNYSSDGRLLASTSMDGSTRVWDATNYSLITVIRETLLGHSVVHAVATFVGNSERMLTLTLGDSGPVYAIWHASAPGSSIALKGHAAPIRSAEFSASAKFVATASNDGTAQILETATLRILQVLAGHSGPVYKVKFRPDDSLVATASDDSTVKVWVAGSGQLLGTMVGHVDKPGWVANIRALSFSPDSRRLVTASIDETARVWDVTTGAELTKISTGSDAPAGVEFSPDGKTIILQTSSWGKSPARIFDSHTGARIGQTEERYPPYDAMGRLSVNPDGSRTASTSGFMNDNVPDNSAAIHDDRLRVVATLVGHTKSINSVQYNADGSRVLTVSDDGTARLWLAFSSTEELVNRSIQAAPRCLFPDERKRAFLTPDVPQWCYDLRKFPFGSSERDLARGDSWWSLIANFATRQLNRLNH